MHSRSADETRRGAARLGAAIEATPETRTLGLVIALSGPLGAGKTEWVRGLAEGLGVDPGLVASPTFVIASEYAGRRRLVHADCYRLESAAELDAAGFADWLEPGQVIAVEWADRFPDTLPDDRILVNLARSKDDPEAREVTIEATGPIAKRVLDELAKLREEAHEPPFPRSEPKASGETP